MNFVRLWQPRAAGVSQPWDGKADRAGANVLGSEKSVAVADAVSGTTAG
jgi:hypothetical protein